MRNLLLRVIYLISAYIVAILFLSSATLKNGGANFDIFIIPTLVALVGVFYTKKINETKYIPLIALAFVVFGFVNPQGEFLHTNLVGTSALILFFHALRKW